MELSWQARISGVRLASLNKGSRYLLIGSLLSLIFVLGISRVECVDIWSFLKTGQFIWEERTIPRQDIFSHTVPSHGWVCYQWLTSPLFFLLYRGFGLNSLILVKAVLITATFAILFKMMLKERLNLYLTVVVTLLAVFISKPRFLVRAEIISYLFTALLLWIISLYKYERRNYLFLLPLLTFVWANLHPGVIFGLMILLIYALCEYLKSRVGYLRRISTSLLSPKEVSNLKVIAFICLLTSLVNPHTYQIFLEVIYLARSDFLRKSIIELARPGLLNYPLLYSLLFLSAFVIVLSWRKLDLSDLVIFIFFSYLGLSAQRNLFICSLLLAPILARYSDWQLRRKGERLLKWSSGHEFKLNSFLSAVLIFVSLSSHPHFGVNESTYPRRAYDFIERSGIKGNVFNPVAWGSSFIWRFYPRHKVFLDGRFLGGERFLRHVYGPLQEGYPDSEKLLNEYGVNFVIVGYPRPGDWPSHGHRLGSLLEESNNWKLIYWDDLARIYLRNSPENKHLADKFSYEAIALTDSSGYKEGMMEQAISEYKRAIKINPDSIRAHFQLGLIYGKKGLWDEAIRECQEVIQIDPSVVEAHFNLGVYLLKKGSLEKAAEKFRAVMRIRRDYAGARLALAETHYALGYDYHKKGMLDEAIREYKAAIKRKPDYLDPHNELGVIYAKKGMDREAIAEFRRVLESDPGNELARHNLELITGEASHD